jgi:DNA-binding SARP family transcriptional activator
MAAATGLRHHLPGGALAPSRSLPSLESEAFKGFPYALLVLDRKGRCVSRNDAATRLIRSTGLAIKDLTCCALLGCGEPDTVLAAGCVTALALGSDETLPEVRVDLDTHAGTVAVWIAAARLAGGKGRVVLQLRPGIAHDRRQRTAPHWMIGPKLRIRTLGRTVVESVEGPIAGAWLDQRTGQLLKYLIAERHRAVAVDEIGESVWPGASYGVGSSVRYYVHALRRRLEPERGSREPSAFVIASAGTYRLNLEQVEIDADQLEAHLTAGLAAADADWQLAAEEIEHALVLYRGEFLADLPYAEWAIPERHRMHDLTCLGLRRLADIRMEHRLIDGAARALERLAIMQPYDEDVHRRLMELDIMQGRRSDAVRRYDMLRSRIRRAFGHDPEFTPADVSRPAL